MTNKPLFAGAQSRRQARMKLLRFCIVGGAAGVLLLSVLKESSKAEAAIPLVEAMKDKVVIPLPNPVCCSKEFQCPVQTGGLMPRNVEMAFTEQAAWYDEKSEELNRNLSQYIDNFRDSQYDNWGHTYAEVKKAMYKWKSERFSRLKSGDRVYESACGIGMNTFMTMEILEEVAGTQSIEFYGNEYAHDSVIAAHCIAGSGRLPAKGRLGAICRADSTNLSFAPADFFHLVFTGYISPLFDPLNLGGSTKENFETYIGHCESSEEKHKVKVLEAQRIQEDWYAKWVEEMIRLAKPGAPVIVEQVSHQLCDAIFDYGGVDKEFWKRAATERKWRIDPSSIVIEDDTLFQKRYHVYLRKLRR